jgi:segregation and condensation protein B
MLPARHGNSDGWDALRTSVRPGAWFVDRPLAGTKWAFLRRARRGADSPAAGECDDLCRRTAKMARLEAVLFVADGPLSSRKLAQYATLVDAAEANQLIAALNAASDRSGSAFRIERVAGGYRMMTRPEYAFWLDKVHQRQSELKLSPPAMETLTIVAYRQPITRADIEAVRGVQCAEMLKQLMERGLVRIGGEDDSLGRPYLYETTRRFLELFGLKNLDELPMADQLRKPAANGTAAAKTNHQEHIRDQTDAGTEEAHDR